MWHDENDKYSKTEFNSAYSIVKYGKWLIIPSTLAFGDVYAFIHLNGEPFKRFG